MADLHPRVKAFGERVQDALWELSQHLKPGMKLTFIMRNPNTTEGDLVVSDDSLDEIAGVIQRRKQAEVTP